MRGKFIALEGPEGAGKSTQAEMLASYMKDRGHDVVRTREPGGVSIAEQLREMLLNPGNFIFPRAELLLYAAGRAQHTEELILPALKEGKHVVCERYTHASVAYQGYGRGLDIGLINMLNDIAAGGVAPDAVIIMDIDVAQGLARVRSSNRGLDRLESENISFHKKVREGYLEIVKTNPDISVVDASQSKEDIHNRILQILKGKNIV
jgi:dTMP kinase